MPSGRKSLGWPLIGDVLSQTGQPLPCADLCSATKRGHELAQAQIIVQLGSSLTTSAFWWQATLRTRRILAGGQPTGRLDPAQHRGRRLVCAIDRWLRQHPAEKRQPWAVIIPELARQAWQAAVASSEAFGEAQLAQRIRRYLPDRGRCLSATAWWYV